jgi:uncharacterized protein (TIGR02453 family)
VIDNEIKFNQFCIKKNKVDMSYFTVDFIRFFEDLAENNCSLWLSENRNRFEFAVKKPFEEFAEELIMRVALEDASMQTNIGDAVYRLKREEFSTKNRKLYHEQMAVCIGKNGRFDRSSPAMYVACSANGVYINIGIQEFDSQGLECFRNTLTHDFKALKFIQSRQHFIEKFGRIHAERFHTLPEQWRTFAGAVPWLYSRSMYIEAQLPTATLLDPDLGGIIMEYFYNALDFINFLKNAIQKKATKKLDLMAISTK